MALKLKAKSAHTSWADVVKATLDADVEKIDGFNVRRMATAAIDAYDVGKLNTYRAAMARTITSLKLDAEVGIATDDVTLETFVVLVTLDADEDTNEDDTDAS